MMKTCMRCGTKDVTTARRMVAPGWNETTCSTCWIDTKAEAARLYFEALAKVEPLEPVRYSKAARAAMAVAR